MSKDRGRKEVKKPKKPKVQVPKANKSTTFIGRTLNLKCLTLTLFVLVTKLLSNLSMARRTATIQKFMASLGDIKRAMHYSLLSEDSRMSPSQVEVLWHVSKQTDMSIKEVANNLHITPSAVTQLIEPLVKEGCLLRNTDPSDRRSVMLHVSPTGKKDLEIVHKARVAWMSTLLKPLSDQELETLVSLFEKIVIKKKEK